MDMEDLLCPQISMDVDETPLDLGPIDDNKDETESTGSDEIPLDVKIKILLEVDEFDAAQIPEPLTEEEEALKQTVFNLGPAVQFMRLHCTSCNTHLGSSPVNQFNRFIHPLLHVLLCKTCYEFYSSGEFDKDEDGSELYCRWCGQGGKVMCCSDCCFVFCQKCVRTNLGKRILDGIKNSDDWKCFVCNPQQLINLKLVCHSLYHYILNEIRIAKETRMEGNLTIDHSMCCSKATKPPTVKRKRSVSIEDTTYSPSHDGSVSKMKNVLKKVMHTFTPNSGTSNGPIGPNPVFVQNTAGPVRSNMPILNKYLKVKILPKQPQPIRPRMPPPLMVPRIPYMINAGNNIRMSAVRGSQNYIPLNPTGVNILPRPISQTFTTPVVNCIPARVTPGLKHNWFDTATSITTNITNQLNRKIASYCVEERNATTIEQLASIHNKLQELLSSSVNNLIQVRKNLRNEFLSDLNKMKFSGKTAPPLAPLTTNNTSNAHTQLENKDDDDVIIINNEEDPLAIPEPVIPEPTKSVDDPDRPRTFLKLKPVASLMEASRLPPKEDTPNGIPIDLCDDDDDDEIKISEDPLKETEPAKTEETEARTEEAVTETEARTEEAVTETETDGVDIETFRQIKRALLESTYEAAVQENEKIKVVADLLTAKEIQRMITVRVILDPKWIPKSKRFSATESKPEEEPVAALDFEEMLSGSVVVNMSRQLDKDSQKDIDKLIRENKSETTDKTKNQLLDVSSDEEVESNSIPKDISTVTGSNEISSEDEPTEVTKAQEISSDEEIEKSDTKCDEPTVLNNINTTDDQCKDKHEENASSNNEDHHKAKNNDSIVKKGNEKNKSTDSEVAKNMDVTNSDENESELNEMEEKSVISDESKIEKEKDTDDLPTTGKGQEEVDSSSKENKKSLNEGDNLKKSNDAVNNFSDSFNPFRNSNNIEVAENGDGIYDRRKDITEPIKDKGAEFDVSTDPVTTTDSGIEVDAKS